MNELMETFSTNIARYVFLHSSENEYERSIDPDNGVFFSYSNVLEFFLNGDNNNWFNVELEHVHIDHYESFNAPFLWVSNCHYNQNWHKWIEKIDERVLSLIRKRKGFLVFINILEGQPLISKDTRDDWLDPMYEKIDKLGIPASQIIYITSNAIATEFHRSHVERDDTMCIIGTFYDSIPYKREIRENRLIDETFDEHYHKLLQSKKNGTLRHFLKPHRNDRYFKTMISHYLWNRGKLDTIWTSHRVYARDEIGWPDTKYDDVNLWLKTEFSDIDSFQRLFPIGMEAGCYENYKNFWSDRPYSNNIYNTGVIEIVPSSWPLWENTCFLRQNLFYHIWNYQPFILYSNYQSLVALKNRGYSTFSDWIDESYDDVYDNGLRLKMVCEEIYRISKFDTDYLLDLYLDMKDILIKNKNVVREMGELYRIFSILNTQISVTNEIYS